MNINGIQIEVCTQVHRLTLNAVVMYHKRVAYFFDLCKNGFIPPEEFATQVAQLTAIYSTGNGLYDNEEASISELHLVGKKLSSYTPGEDFYKKYML